MSGELERVRASVQKRNEQMTEFVGLPEELREAALEYARGLELAVGQSDPPPDSEDVQFVLVGVEQAGRAVLFASTSVTEAKFARRMDGVDRVEIRPGGPVARIPRMSILVGARMTSFEQYVGDDYASALATLQAEWQRKQRRSSRVCPCSQMDYGHTYNDHDEERRRLPGGPS